MSKSHKVKVAIDLTPLRAGGENGGAKTLVVTLLQEFSRCWAEDFDYLLIAETWNYEELLTFEGPNITCLLQSEIYRPIDSAAYLQESTLSDPLANKTHLTSSTFKGRLKQKVKSIAKQGIKAAISIAQPWLQKDDPLIQRLKSSVKRRLLQLPAGAQLLPTPPEDPQQISPQPLTSLPILRGRYGIDLLFCPFSSPHLAEEGLPLVAIAYDLQHLDLPFFFASEERLHRTQFLRNLVDRADQIICISDFTKQSFIQHLGAEESQLISVPICIHERLKARPESEVIDTLSKLGLLKNQYLYFPANFWPHKNHRMLLAAYSIYRQQHPETALDLVFTGALEGPQTELREVAAYLGCEDKVHFLGFLSEEELVALWQGCKGLVFPSLYEGFGIPVLEAMWFDRPVACSTVGSLPEVGDNAVIYFDPRKPEAIAQAITQIAHDETLTHQLRERAREHIQSFSQEAMAKQYLTIFKNVLTAVAASPVTIN